MSPRNLAWLLTIAAVSLFGLAVSHSAPLKEKDKDYEMVRLVVDVLHEVRHRYVNEIDSDRERKLVEDMINGGLERLDPHSSYINPKDYKQFSKASKGKFGGVGIQISSDRQSGQLMVISPMVGTPAYEAGVLAGDIIFKIDGKSTENMRLSEAVELIQGDPGYKVTLTVVHESSREPVDLEMVRREIKVESVLGDLRKPNNPKEWDYFVDKESKIAYIRLVAFSETAPEELSNVLVQLQREGLRGLVLDLRNNPGGLLRAAVSISNLFLDNGAIVSTKGRNQKPDVNVVDPKKTLLPPGQCPMVVLINKYSASASEIVSAALQDHNRAVVIGERSYGKGSVQNVIEMENKSSALKLTTASYWRPSGKNIHRFPESKESDEWGVKPNDAGYKVTAQALTALRTAGVPDTLVARLQSVMGERYGTEKEYLDALSKVLSSAEVSKHKAALIEQADRGFEVPLKDEERLDYMLYRRDRDIVHGKPGTPPPAQPRSEKENERNPLDGVLKDDFSPPRPLRVPPKGDKEKDKEKKPFEDRVLQKALDFLRGEIKRAQNRPVVPEVANS